MSVHLDQAFATASAALQRDFDAILAKALAGNRINPAVSLDGAVPRAAITGIGNTLKAAFKRHGPAVIAQVRQDLGRLPGVNAAARLFDLPGEDDDAVHDRAINNAGDIADDVDLDWMKESIAPITGHLKGVAGYSGAATLDGIRGIPTGRPRQDALDLLDVRSGYLASDRAAELVGKKWVGGRLIDNPDANYAITDTTRDMIRDTVASGLFQHETADQIADDIRNGTTFGDSRAESIARTEVTSMHNQVALAAYKEAQAMGVPLRKLWQINGDNPCDDCQANAADGAIDLDDTFSSGDDAPGAHPNCSCELISVTPDDNSDDD